MAKLSPEQVEVMVDLVFRHVVVTLQDGENAMTWGADNVDAWGAIQRLPHKRVRRGDLVTTVSRDGMCKVDSQTVMRTQGESVWLGKPLRVVNFEESDILRANAAFAVVHVGPRQFGIRRIRDGYEETSYFDSEAAAWNEIVRRQPRKVA